jgi:uncharacterized protein with ParB-like and HNH nuclease domain
MSVDPKYFTLRELLDGRIFKIPEYQRAYSWTKKQRDDLKADIEGIIESNRDHFMATMVCLERNQEPITVGAREFYQFDVVDGQQRITTLIALLKAIQMGLPNGDDRDDLLRTLIKGQTSTLLFQTNSDDWKILEPYIREGKTPTANEIETLSQKNLRDLIAWSKNFVADWASKNNDLVHLLKIVLNRLGFVFYPLQDESIVYTVFEVLNSRGLDVN